MKFFPLLVFLMFAPLSDGENDQFKVGITGTSTLHSWTADVLECDCEAKVQLDESGISAVESVNFEIPVNSIEGARGATMTEKIFNAFKGDQFPRIVFEYVSHTVDNGVITVTGDLEMAGQSHSVSIDFKQEEVGENWKLVGQKELLMSEWGMEKPTAMFGQIVTGDAITVNFEITL